MTSAMVKTQSMTGDIGGQDEVFKTLMSADEIYDVDGRIDELSSGLSDDVAKSIPLAECLPAFLALLRWRGNSRQLRELLPRTGEHFDLTDFQNLLVRLGYRTKITECRYHEARRSKKAAVFVSRKGETRIVVRRNSRDFDLTGMPKAYIERCAPWTRGRLIQVEDPDEQITDPADLDSRGWFRANLRPLRPVFANAIALSALSNMFAIATPLFIMSIYDRVLPTGSLETLVAVGCGVLLALGFDHWARDVRAKLLNYANARVSYVAGNAIFERLLSLSTRLTERASVNAQVARIRDVERARELLTGPLAQAVFNLPFSIIFFGVIYAVGGVLVLIPVTALVVYCAVAFVMMEYINRCVDEAARVNAVRQELVLESIQKMRALRVAGAYDAWMKRFVGLSAQSARANYRHANAIAVLSTLSNLVAVSTGLVILGFGATGVLAGSITTGGLIATMMLSWRILSPMQSAFMGMSRLKQLRSSVEQIDTLMRQPAEAPKHAPRQDVENMTGAVRFENVSFRYGREIAPALTNISFSIEPGESIAVVGGNGAGKSSILKLLAGLYDPQMGRVMIDNRDLRQFDRIAFRNRISYVDQSPHLFQGTIAQNLHLAHPGATDQDIWNALALAGARDEVEDLEGGLETIIDTRSPKQLHTSLVIQLSLARAYLKQSPIVLLDEPINGLDFEGEFDFVAALESLKGKATVLVVSHRPSHIRAVDKVLEIERGAVRYFGPSADWQGHDIREAEE